MLNYMILAVKFHLGPAIVELVFVELVLTHIKLMAVMKPLPVNITHSGGIISRNLGG